MRPILLATVQYTGTRFFIDVIEQATGTVAKRLDNMMYNTKDWPEFGWCHIGMRDIEAMHGFIETCSPLIFTTMRDKRSVIESWVSRGNARYKAKQHLAMWNIFECCYEPIKLSVDRDDREWLLDRATEALQAYQSDPDIELVANWDQPIGHRS